MKLKQFLKAGAILAFFCCAYPLVAWVHILVLKQFTLSQGMAGTAALLVCAMLGWCAGALAQRTIQSHWRKSARNVVHWSKLLLCLVPAYAVFRLYDGQPDSLVWSMAVFSGFSYLIGTVFYPVGYAKILPNVLIAVPILLTGSLLLFLWVLQTNIGLVLPCDNASLLGAFLLFLVLFALIKNQANIDFMMDRRKHDTAHLPQKIRYYNLALVSAALLLLVAAFVFRRPVAAAFRFIAEMVKLFFIKLFLLIIKLYELMPTAEKAPYESQVERANNANYLSAEDGWWPDLYGNAGFVVLGIVILAALWCNRRWIKKILSAAYDGMRRLLFPSRKEKTESNGAYYDCEETLSREESPSPEPVRLGWFRWRLACRAYHKMPLSAEKLRLGYQLSLWWLFQKGILIEQEDTTLDILEKSQTALSSSQYRTATRLYNQVRYGEQAPTADDAALYAEFLSSLGSRRKR